jgi:hypothetical protein
MIKSYA